MSEPQAYLNGQYVPASQAAVPVDDAGFMLGSTVAEQLRTFGGRLFRLDAHLERLAHSLSIVGVDPGLSRSELAEIAEELTARNHALLATGDDLGLTIFVTPGRYSGWDGDAAATPTVCLHTRPLPFRIWQGKYGSGDALVTTDVQQVPPQCWPPELKCRSRMHYYLADRQARAIEPGARALLLDDEGHVIETSTANILLFRTDQGLITPPWRKVLPGVSLAAITDLAVQIGLQLSERELTTADVAAAEEVLLTSTSPCVLPVVRFNGQPIGSGQPGDVFRRLLQAWSQMVGVDIVGQANRFAQR